MLEQLSKMTYPFKNHEKRKWLEHALKELCKKLINTIEEINEVDADGLKKLKIGGKGTKLKFRGFPVIRSQKSRSRVKYPLVKVIYAEVCRYKRRVERQEEIPPSKQLPEAKRFWKYVDVCHKLSFKACNVREAKEAISKEEAKKCLKLPPRKRKHVKKQTSSKFRCFARTRPGFLTSIMDSKLFYPVFIVFPKGVRKPRKRKRRSGRIYSANKQKKERDKVEKVGPKPISKPKTRAKTKPVLVPLLVPKRKPVPVQMPVSVPKRKKKRNKLFLTRKQRQKPPRPKLKPKPKLRPHRKLRLKSKVKPEVELNPKKKLKPKKKPKPKAKPQRCSARISNANAKKNAENDKLQNEQCTASKSTMKKRKRKNSVAKEKPQTRCKRKK